MSHSSWLRELFESIDAKNTDRFLGFLTDDASFRYGSSPPAVGRDAIAAAVNQFFVTIESCSHEIVRVWEHPDSLICQGTVEYVRLDGRTMTLPFCNVFGLRDEKIQKYEIYIDPTPLMS